MGGDHTLTLVLEPLPPLGGHRFLALVAARGTVVVVPLRLVPVVLVRDSLDLIVHDGEGEGAIAMLRETVEADAIRHHARLGRIEYEHVRIRRMAPDPDDR